jgi:hypothetical protein
MTQEEKQFISWLLGYAKANADDENVIDEIAVLTSNKDCSEGDVEQFINQVQQNFDAEAIERPKKKFVIEAVDSLIKKLQGLHNQGASVHVEAPIYLAGEQEPYRWPVKDYCIAIVDVEEEEDSDGDSILLKSAVVFE